MAGSSKPAATVTVKPGNTLSGIAAKAGVSLAAVKAANPQITNPSLIKPGQVVNIPAAAPAKPAITTTTSPATAFVGPIPVGATRTTSGYVTSTGTTVIPGVITPSTSTTTSTSTSTTNTSTSTSSTSRTVRSTFYSGTGAGRVLVTVYDDGSTDTTPAPDNSGAASTTDPLLQLQIDAQNAAKLDAFKLLQDTFTGYGLEGLIPVIEGYMKSNIGPNEATLLLKQTPEYRTRFAGNFDATYGRAAKGLNVLTEAEYLSLENQYGNLMNQYGVGNLANRTQFAQLIGGDVSATELNSRLDLAVTNVKNADPTVIQTLKAYYPTISDANLVSYFLAPAETLPQLQRQVRAADIGAAATQQGITGVGVTRAEQLAGLGVSYAQAQKGYGEIAAVAPTAKVLNAIYAPQTGTTYGQADLENQYLLGSGEAALKQRELNKLELGQFSGQSGIDVRAAALGKSIQGAF